MRKVTLIDYLLRKEQQKIKSKFNQDFEIKIQERRKWIKENNGDSFHHNKTPS